MNYQIFKKLIKAESKEPGLAYISYTGEREETLTSNFIEELQNLTDGQVQRAIKEGLLYADSHDVIVVTKKDQCASNICPDDDLILDENNSLRP